MVPQVCVYEDAFKAFYEFPKLFQKLSGLDGTVPSVEDIIKLLNDLGFEDHTEYDNPHDLKKDNDPKAKWSNIFNTSHYLWGHIEKAWEAAKNSHYPYFSFNGQIRRSRDASDTGLTVDDIIE
jgi:hypothetical protein